MGVKKPAVVAKTARKVRITATEAAYAKSQGMSLEELAKSKLPKRGRPAGSKNKPKEKPIDWEKLAKQLQEALAAEMKENEALTKVLEEFKSVIRLDSSFTFWDRLVFLFTGKVDGNKSV